MYGIEGEEGEDLVCGECGEEGAYWIQDKICKDEHSPLCNECNKDVGQ